MHRVRRGPSGRAWAVGRLRPTVTWPCRAAGGAPRLAELGQRARGAYAARGGARAGRGVRGAAPGRGGPDCPRPVVGSWGDAGEFRLAAPATRVGPIWRAFGTSSPRKRRRPDDRAAAAGAGGGRRSG